MVCSVSFMKVVLVSNIILVIMWLVNYCCFFIDSWLVSMIMFEFGCFIIVFNKLCWVVSRLILLMFVEFVDVGGN